MFADRQQMLAEARRNVQEVSGQDAKVKQDNDEIDILLDVREPAEWTAGHIPGAVHVPLGMLHFRGDPASPLGDPDLTANVNASIVVYCESGVRSLLGADLLKKMGYTNVVSMAKGISGWGRSGFPVVYGA
jgi:rhodanese-related sulfurtransferase